MKLAAFTPEEAARLSGVSPERIRKWRERGHLPWSQKDGTQHPRYTIAQVSALKALGLHPDSVSLIGRAITRLGGPEVVFAPFHGFPIDRWLVTGPDGERLVETDAAAVAALTGFVFAILIDVGFIVRDIHRSAELVRSGIAATGADPAVLARVRVELQKLGFAK